MQTFSLEGELHDKSRLPHLHSSAEISCIFPKSELRRFNPMPKTGFPAPTEIKVNESMGELWQAEIAVNEGMGELLS